MSLHQRFSLMFYFEIFITEKMASQLDDMNTGKSVWAKWKWGAGEEKNIERYYRDKIYL